MEEEATVGEAEPEIGIVEEGEGAGAADAFMGTGNGAGAGAVVAETVAEAGGPSADADTDVVTIGADDFTRAGVGERTCTLGVCAGGSVVGGDLITAGVSEAEGVGVSITMGDVFCRVGCCC